MKTPDWRLDHDLTTYQQYHLIHLSELMADDPILWIMVQGIQTSQSIAARVCWPHDWVMIGLRGYKKLGRVYDLEGRKSVMWMISDQEEDLLELKAWIHTQRGKWGLFSRPE